MKRTLLITLLLIPFLGIAQTIKPIDGFLGIKFGSDKAAVMAAASAKGGTFHKDESNADRLGFTDVKLGSRIANSVWVKLVNDKAFEADYIFDIEPEGKVIGEFHDFSGDLSMAYGQSKQIRNFKSPYKAEDSESEIRTGIFSGDIDYFDYWEDGIGNTIKIEITPKMRIEITYQDKQLVEEAIAKQNAKTKSDL